jgi:dTDP-4-dehydrorhamnose 3,5-epimerase
MNYKSIKWNYWDTAYLTTFGIEVPIYTPSIYREFRGEIFTTYHSEHHPVKKYINNTEVHSRFSKSYRGVLRGLHYDSKTWKLVQSIMGDIYLVILDVRINSKTYGKWESYVITEKTRQQILIPPGFANGHYALTDCVFHYNLFYNGEYVDESEQRVIKWNDINFNINWPSKAPILQERDS